MDIGFEEDKTKGWKVIAETQGRDGEDRWANLSLASGHDHFITALSLG